MIFFSLISSIAALLLLSPALGAPPSNALIDETGIFRDQVRIKTEKYLAFIHQQHGIDYRVVILKPQKDRDLASLANRLYNDSGVGRDTAGRGLVLVLDLENRAARVEVGYALEPHLTDAKASEMLRNHLAPYFATGNLRSAAEASIEFLVNEFKGKRDQLVHGPNYQGSGGAGAHQQLSEIPESTLTQETKEKLKRVLVPQPSPELALKLEFAMMHRGYYYRDIPLYDPDWKNQRVPEFPPDRVKEMAKMIDQPFQTRTAGDHAIAYHPNHQNLGPIFFRKTGQGWTVDRTTVQKFVIYDFSNDGWYLLATAGDPYVELLRSVYQLEPVRLNSGRTALRPKPLAKAPHAPIAE